MTRAAAGKGSGGGPRHYLCTLRRYDASLLDLYYDTSYDGGEGGINNLGRLNIVVGVGASNTGNRKGVVDVLLHEILEVELMAMELAWVQESQAAMIPTRDRVFILSHRKFSELMSRTAPTILEAMDKLLPALARIWKGKSKK